MRYLINRKTKEHKVLHRHTEYATCDWQVVEADDDGWIAHTGKECPLPDDVRCEAKISDGFPNTNAIARYCEWGRIGVHSITHYRPILTEKVQEPEPYVDDGTRPEPPPADYRDDLVSRLKAAHEAAQQIPDLEAELREVLAGMGYDLVTRSPFVEPEDYATAIAEPEAAVETLQSALDDIWACSKSYSHDDLKNKIAFYCEKHSLVEPEAAVKTPQGYVLMPLEPTQKMLDAMHDNCFSNPKWRKLPGFPKGEAVYEVLLAYSLTKPTQDFSAVVAAEGLDDWRNWREGE